MYPFKQFHCITITHYKRTHSNNNQLYYDGGDISVETSPDPFHGQKQFRTQKQQNIIYSYIKLRNYIQMMFHRESDWNMHVQKVRDATEIDKLSHVLRIHKKLRYRVEHRNEQTT